MEVTKIDGFEVCNTSVEIDMDRFQKRAALNNKGLDPDSNIHPLLANLAYVEDHLKRVNGTSDDIYWNSFWHVASVQPAQTKVYVSTLCPHCKKLAPLLEAPRGFYVGKIKGSGGISCLCYFCRKPILAIVGKLSMHTWNLPTR